MDILDIKQRVRNGRFRLSTHAEMEAGEENLEISQIVEAILDDDILEQYPDTGRGPSCLLIGFAGQTPIHVVCGMQTGYVIIVTVYIPGPPKFVDPWTRQRPYERK
jgi:hypothetical protein